MSCRCASHAGSWYSENASELSLQLDVWLGKADLSHGPARAIISPLLRDDDKRPDGMTFIPWKMGRPLVYDATCVDKLASSHLPGAELSSLSTVINRFALAFVSLSQLQKKHAGYSYCGACAAFAYRQISPVVVKRIFILGPSHHVRLGGCALSSLDKYSTPLYDLTIDKEVYAELEATRQFELMDVQTDEDEHSIEMQLPYIAKVMEEYRAGFTIVPILVGSLTTEKEAKYGSILASYLADPQNLLVISSDFCHWGSRFRYTWRDGTDPIYQSIERLDRQGMDLIEKMDPRAFSDYLNRYGNTICGRHPIGVLLQAIAKLRSQSSAPKMSLQFLKYAQSSKCMTQQDSSVSYASASLVFE